MRLVYKSGVALALAAWSAFAAGCLRVEKEGLSCPDQGPCPDGQRCHAGRCWSTPPVDGALTVELPDLPVALPDLPVALPDLPVALPDLPVELPDRPEGGTTTDAPGADAFDVPPADIAAEAPPPDKRPRGADCQTNDQCQDGWCAPGDKVCCSSECKGQCETCQGGTCRLMPDGPPDPKRGACLGQNDARCGGRCDGTKPDCQYPAIACGQPQCECNSFLGGCWETKGSCVMGECKLQKTDCPGGHSCNGTACAIGCTVEPQTGCYGTLSCCRDRPPTCRTIGCKPFCASVCP